MVKLLAYLLAAVACRDAYGFCGIPEVCTIHWFVWCICMLR